jgi:hypothetical protein
MKKAIRIAANLFAIILLTTSTLQAEEFSDPDYGFRFTVNDQKWKPVPIPVATLGEPVTVLSNGPQERALAVVFVRSQEKSEPVSEARLKSLSEKMARVASAVSGTTIVTNEIEQIAGRKAISFRVTGPGTGMAIGGGGTPTTQHWLAFPRAQDLIVFQVTAANDKFESAYKDVRAMAESATFEDTRPQRQQPTFNDDSIGLSVSYPASPWIRGGYELGDFVVPGYSLRIWSAPSSTGTTDDGISKHANRLALFMQFSGRAFTPQELLDLSIPGLTQSGAQVVEQDIREIDGKKAMWLVVEGKSKTGANLTGSGNVATRQLWIGIPRIHNGNHNIVVFLMNTPAADYEARLQEVQAMLKTLKIQADF